jgi:hypothetical protein
MNIGQRQAPGFVGAAQVTAEYSLHQEQYYALILLYKAFQKCPCKAPGDRVT